MKKSCNSFNLCPDCGAKEESGIYVHYPQCARKCGYCDFATVSLRSFPAKAYIDALIEEFDQRVSHYKTNQITTLYLGGGSPSLCPDKELIRLIGHLKEYCPEIEEVTIESNPADLSKERLLALYSSGVTRLSIGVQSLNDKNLKKLTRTHSAQQAIDAIKAAKTAGFYEINADLICGIWEQRIDEHLDDVEKLCALEPEHISVYSLTLAQDSPLFKKGQRALFDDDMADMLQRSKERLQRLGYQHYEVSNYCKKGHPSRHNRLVWRSRPYLGLGASAHSMRKTSKGFCRRENAGFEDYMAMGDYDESVSTGEIALLERLLLGLRMKEGLCLTCLDRDVGNDALMPYREKLKKFDEMGLIILSSKAIQPTDKGLFFVDEMMRQLAEIMG